MNIKSAINFAGGADEPDPPPDPFDPKIYRISQDFMKSLHLKKNSIIPIAKPSKEKWVHTSPDDEDWLPTRVIELSRDGYFLPDPKLWTALSLEATFVLRLLVKTIDRQGNLSFWPVKMPSATGTVDKWSESALEAAKLAKEKWVRVIANLDAGGYETIEADASISLPVWPETSLRDAFATAFKDRRIDSLDHIVLRRLRGEV